MSLPKPNEDTLKLSASSRAYTPVQQLTWKYNNSYHQRKDLFSLALCPRQKKPKNQSFGILTSDTTMEKLDQLRKVSRARLSTSLMTTAAIAKVPETAVTIGVMWVRSRTGSPQKAFVEFKAAGRANVISMEAQGSG